MDTHRFITWPPALTLLLALAACGGGGGSDSPPPEPASLRTLAYVVTSCHEDKQSSTFRQSLRIRRGEAAEVTVAEIPPIRLPPFAGFCHLFGQYRVGLASIAVGGFQRMGISPDGSSVVF